MGKPRHQKGDFAAFAHEMLVYSGKLPHFLEIDPYFVDRDEQAHLVLRKLIEKRVHLRAPIARTRGLVIPLESDKLADGYTFELLTVQRVKEITRRNGRLVENVLEHSCRRSGVGGYPSLRCRLLGHKRKEGGLARTARARHDGRKIGIPEAVGKGVRKLLDKILPSCHVGRDDAERGSERIVHYHGYAFPEGRCKHHSL